MIVDRNCESVFFEGSGDRKARIDTSIVRTIPPTTIAVIGTPRSISHPNRTGLRAVANTEAEVIRLVMAPKD